MASADETFMGIALAMARRGLGRTWPNPAVGAVLVAPGDPGEVIARGWTMPGGRPHAETVAIERAGGRARGATLYVTLEPCAHTGRTPPCTEAIIAAGVARVVCGMRDPDPRVSGRGLEALRAAGIEVQTGVLEERAQRVSLGHVLRVTAGRPLVTLKLAVGADGLVPRGDGGPTWITAETARAHGHLLRARHDAIAVGRGTVEADDPTLTCRLPGMEERSPVRVVLDSRARVSPTSKLLESAGTIPLWLFCAEDAPQSARARIGAAGGRIFAVGRDANGMLNLTSVLETLGDHGITRLLIEGGPHLAASFLEAGFIDEAMIFQGKEDVGPGGLNPFVNGGLDRLTEHGGLAVCAERNLGSDTMILWKREKVV